MSSLLVFLAIYFNVISLSSSISYPRMSCGSSGYSNNWDSSGTVSKSNDFFSGQKSYHSNSKEDRRYDWKYCKVNSNDAKSSNIQSGSDIQLVDTWRDWGFRRGCGGNTALKYVYSSHDNDNEDRSFRFKCRQINNYYYLTSCSWTSWLNDFDNPLDYQCRYDGLIRTVESYHSNSKEDRRWRFECCRLAYSEFKDELIPMECYESSNYENDLDGSLNVLKSSYFFNGIDSYHSNNKEDRRFKFRYCKPKDISTNAIVNKVELSKTSYDSEWTKSCKSYNNGNSGIIGIKSYHSNNREDREYTITCGHLDGSRYGLTNCGWTGDLSNFDSTNNFDCPGNGVIRGIWSRHDNNKEDRLFRFECCSMVTNKFSDIIGKWALILSCKGCGNLEHEVSIGVSNSRTETTSQEYNQALELSISAGYEFAGFSTSVTVTSSFAWATSQSLETTFEKTQVTTQKVSCDKTYLFQWKQEATDHLEGTGDAQIYIYGQNFLCTENQYPACPLGWCKDSNCYECKDGYTLE